MKQQLKNSKIELTSSCSSDYLTVQADEEMIEQVLINLIKNSIESLLQNGTVSGKIELNGKYDGQNILIEVADNGPGIIPEAINRIFVPFFTTKKTGSGIGLALSRQIMQLHNGTLTVESVLNVRTVFTLHF
jgi:signal transduction histidine kinase